MRRTRTTRLAVLGVIGVVLLVLLTPTVVAYWHQRSRIEALRSQVAAQEADVRALQAEQQRWNDPAYVEQQARQRLKFVRPGEKSYTVIDADPAKAAAAKAATNLPWYGSVWRSIRSADTPAGAPSP